MSTEGKYYPDDGYLLLNSLKTLNPDSRLASMTVRVIHFSPFALERDMSFDGVHFEAANAPLINDGVHYAFAFYKPNKFGLPHELHKSLGQWDYHDEEAPWVRTKPRIVHSFEDTTLKRGLWWLAILPLASLTDLTAGAGYPGDFMPVSADGLWQKVHVEYPGVSPVFPETLGDAAGYPYVYSEGNSPISGLRVTSTAKGFEL